MHIPCSSVVEIALPYQAPFDWAHMLNYLEVRSSPGVELIKGNSYRRAIKHQDSPGVLLVQPHPRRNALIARLEGAVHEHAAALTSPIRQMFDLDRNPGDLQAGFAEDPWLSQLVTEYPGIRVPGTWSVFELVVRTIVGQQVSVKGATTIMGRIIERAGMRLDLPSEQHLFWEFPTPIALADADLNGVGMPGRRIAAVQNFARAVANGAVCLCDPVRNVVAIRTALLNCPGIGPWTVEYAAMRALRDTDAWPENDLVLMQAIANRHPALLRPGQRNEHAERWRPWRAYAAMLIWNGVVANSIARG